MKSLKKKGKMVNIKAWISEMNQIIDADFINLKPWRELADWKLYEDVRLDKSNIAIIKILQTKNHIRFLTVIPPHTGFGKHSHDCNEICTVIGGTLMAKGSDVVYNENDQYVASKGVSHEPYNPSLTNPCYLIVDFYR